MRPISLGAPSAVFVYLCACSSTTNTTTVGPSNEGSTAGMSGNGLRSIGGASSGTLQGSTMAGGSVSTGTATGQGNSGGTLIQSAGSGTNIGSGPEERASGGASASLSVVSTIAGKMGTGGGLSAVGGMNSGGKTAIGSAGASPIGGAATTTLGGNGGAPRGSSTLGGAATLGGATAAGGKAANGGLPTAQGGTASVGGAAAGGATQTGGAAAGGSAAGGGQAVGGTSAAAGRTGCSRPSDCVNPHAPTCVMTCDDGTCKGAMSSTLGVAPQSGPKDETPRVALWNGNSPYVLYPCLNYTPGCIKIHPLDTDGAMSAQPAILDLPEEFGTADAINAAISGNRLGLLWHSERTTDSMTVTSLAIATLSGGTPSQELFLKEETLLGPYTDFLDTSWLQPLGNDKWAVVLLGGAHEYAWRGAVVQTTSPSNSPPFSGDAARLSNSPYSVAARSSYHRPPQAAAVLNNTLFVTGLDIQWSGGDPPPMLIMGRYDVRTMAPLTPTAITLSLSSYPTDDGYLRTPAIAKLGNRLAAVWTEYTPSKTMLLGRALFNEDGTTARARSAVPSVLIPKGLVETPTGAAMLLASRIDETASPATHTLVVQRLDSNLEFVGPTYPVNAPSTVEPSAVVARPSNDGRVLVTFRQDYAQHRILHADLCQ